MGGLVPPGFKNRFSESPVESGRPFSVDNAEQKAKTVLEKAAVKMESFVDLYGHENIAKDLQEVERLKKIFAKEETSQIKEALKLAVILEAAINDQINQNQWFGPHAKALRTTDFDDMVNGVDTVVEFKEPQVATSYLALGVDVTYRHDLSSKFERIRQEIESGNLARIKYLKSSDSSFRGELRQVPRLVVAVDGESTLALAKAWYQNAPGLASNPTRFQIVNELFLQLETFKRYALKVGQPAVAEKFSQSTQIIIKIKDDIERRMAPRKHDISDQALSQMKQQLQEIF